MKKKKLSYSRHKIDGIVTLVVSLLVLFTSLWNPRISVVVSFFFLVLYSIFKIFVDKR
jgi:Ca2+/Na+ antiporter